MSQIYPYIPKEYYPAVMWACWFIRKYKSLPKAVRYSSKRFDVDPDILSSHIRARIDAGRKYYQENKSIK